MGQVRVWGGVPMVAGGATALGGFEFEELRSLPNASAARQWWKHCITQVSACMAVLHINVDATAVCLFQRHGRGKVFLAKNDKALVQNMLLRQERTYVNHVGFLCGNLEIRCQLSQIWIGNERTIREADLATISSNCPESFIILRRRSACLGGSCLGGTCGSWLRRWHPSWTRCNLCFCSTLASSIYTSSCSRPALQRASCPSSCLLEQHGSCNP